MTTSMYCLYVGFDYTYIDVNALAQGIKSFLASHVWSQAVAGARTYGTDSPAITSQHANHSATETSMYVFMRAFLHVCMYVCIYVCIFFYFDLVYLCQCNIFINELYILKKRKKREKQTNNSF